MSSENETTKGKFLALGNIDRVRYENSSSNPSFLALGNIDRSRNITKVGEQTVYGGGTYSSITATKLGYKAAVLTRGNLALARWIKNLENMGIEVFVERDKATLEVINDYSTGKWVQKILSTTGKIVFDLDRKFDIIHINPLFKEIDRETIQVARKKCKILSLEVQGLLRNSNNGTMFLEPLRGREHYFKDVDVLHVSDAEAKFVTKETEPEEICRDLQSAGPKVVLYTLGAKGSFIMGKEFHEIPAFRVREVDPTGAGDTYSASFDVKFFEGAGEKEAGFFASAAASFCVEDFGYKNIQPRERVEERFKRLVKEAE